MRVAVVGAGAIGLASAWNLARRGHAVEVFEAGPIPNPVSASVDQHRLCRVPYGSQDGYAALMVHAFGAWDRLWAALGERLYEETGCLTLCTAEGDWTDRSRASMDRLGLPYRLLTPGEVEARCPMLHAGDARYGMFTEPGGALFADAITTGFARLTEEAGAVLRPATPVSALEEDGTVVAGGTRAGFDAVLLAAGAWTPALAPWLLSPVTPIRHVVAYLEPPAARAAEWARSPILMDMGGPRGMYAAPPVRGRGLKIACGAMNHPAAPDSPRVAAPGEAEAILAAWGTRLRDAGDYRLRESRVCVYAGSEGENFVAARRGRILAMTGCAGHAFKFSALLGEGLAVALTGDESDLAWMRGDAGAFDPRRMAA